MSGGPGLSLQPVFEEAGARGLQTGLFQLGEFTARQPSETCFKIESEYGMGIAQW